MSTLSLRFVLEYLHVGTYASHGEDIAIDAPVPPTSELPRATRGRAHARYGRIERISNFPRR